MAAVRASRWDVSDVLADPDRVAIRITWSGIYLGAYFRGWTIPAPAKFAVDKNRHQTKPDMRVVQMRGRALSYSQWLEENRAKRCTVDLGELKHAWTAKPEAELAELLEAQAGYDELQALRLIVLPHWVSQPSHRATPSRTFRSGKEAVSRVLSRSLELCLG